MIICITSVGAFELPDASVAIFTGYDILVLVTPLSCIACLVLAKSISTCSYFNNEEGILNADVSDHV
jgi:hypothetical protein